MAIEYQRRRWSVDAYEAMVTAGILGPDDRVELVEGEILEMAPIGPLHANCVRTLDRLFMARLGDLTVVSIQSPVRLGELSEPEPDVAVLRPGLVRYRSTHPGPADILWLVEVADTTLVQDRNLKLPLYARFGIPEVWIVDLAGWAVERYHDPAPHGYRHQIRLGPGDTLVPGAFPNISFSVAEILGPTG